MHGTLVRRLPPRDWLDNGLVLDCFLDAISDRGLDLYPAQEEAVLALFENRNVILNTPTGSGKSLVASALHMKSFAWGRRSIYTCPIKALVNEKFLALCREFGSRNVGLVTGDSSVNADAPILCCTAEILANLALRYGDGAAVDDVVMDEFHYYADRDRGVAWQVPLLALPGTRFLLMSATLGDTDFFTERLTALNGLETVVVKSNERPVPLDFHYQETPLHETVTDLVRNGKAPLYVVHFTQADAADEAQNLLSLDFCTKDEKKAIAVALEGTRFDSPYGKDIQKLLRHGVGLHHAGLLPKYRILVERLAQKGLLKIICGTDTLGVGVNVPIRTVVFTKLCKFDGEKVGLLSVRDFRQIAGRAGRRGFDNQGTVIGQAPEHVIENLRLEQKAGGDPSKLRKIVRRKPPERGFVPWNKDTFQRLVTAPPEPLVSRFQVGHGMVLSVLGRDRGGVEALRALIRDCHETEVTKKRLRAKAFELFRSLHDRGIIQIVPPEERLEGHTPLRVNVELQTDFSLNQALSLWLIDTVQLLDAAAPDYAVRALSLVEAIHENPEVILRKQVSRIKTAKLHELKMEGVEYEERMAELEKIEHPKPEGGFIYDTFNAFAAAHPWVGQENVRPKSVAREMYEAFHTFDEYVREYDLQRSEGVLLRYLSEVYRALAQTIPDPLKTDELKAIEIHFGTLIREVDSSLLDEWRGLGGTGSMQGSGSGGEAVPEGASAMGGQGPARITPRDVTRDAKEFTLMVRNAVFRFVRALALHDFAGALAQLAPLAAEEAREEEGSALGVAAATDDANADVSPPHALADYFTGGPADLEALVVAFEAEHERIEFDADARSPRKTLVRPFAHGTRWAVEQILSDPNDFDDWSVMLEVDVDASREADTPVLRLVRIGPLSEIGAGG